MSTPKTFGFPPGYFIIRSVANGRVLDVEQDDMEDGTEIILWPQTETSLVETRRKPESNNQVFFIDPSGALCSRSSGHAVDIEGDKLVLRHRRPVSYPFPNTYSHPLPIFNFSPESREITIDFSSNPDYGSPDSSWKSKSHLLTALPLRKPKTIIDDAADFLNIAASNTFSFFSGKPPPTPAKPDEVFDGVIDLGENEVAEEDRGEENEIDDSPEPLRKLRMVAVANKPESDKRLGEKAKSRRQWEVYSLRTTDKKTGA